jgi:hypothetical protein
LFAAVGEVVQVYGMKKTLEICDAYNEVQRIKEELALLPREMRAQLQYWEAVMDKQDRLIALLQVPASGPSTVADLAQQLQASGMQVGPSSVPTAHLVAHLVSLPTVCGAACCAMDVKEQQGRVGCIGGH